MKVLLTGGGTGGHIYPALAVAEKIRQREPEAELLFVGTESGIEMRLVPEHGYRIETVPARAIEVDGGIAGRVKGGMKAALGMRSGIKAARRILKAFRPDAVVGTGLKLKYTPRRGTDGETVMDLSMEREVRVGDKLRALELLSKYLGLSVPPAAGGDGDDGDDLAGGLIVLPEIETEAEE